MREETKGADMIDQEAGLRLLRAPFTANQISKLPKPTKKDNPKGKCAECGGWHGLPAVHLDYVGHAAITDRLLDADSGWTWEPLSLEDGLPHFDTNGGLWIKLTVCGVTRLGYGNAANSEYKDIGAREKEVIGDALRNAGMRFGMALDLWHKGDLHADQESVPKAPSKPVAKPKVSTYPMIEPLLNHEFSQCLGLNGRWTDQTFVDIFKADRAMGFDWTLKRNAENREGKDLPPWAIDFLVYAADCGLAL